MSILKKYPKWLVICKQSPIFLESTNWLNLYIDFQNSTESELVSKLLKLNDPIFDPKNQLFVFDDTPDGMLSLCTLVRNLASVEFHLEKIFIRQDLTLLNIFKADYNIEILTIDNQPIGSVTEYCLEMNGLSSPVEIPALVCENVWVNNPKEGRSRSMNIALRIDTPLTLDLSDDSLMAKDLTNDRMVKLSFSRKVLINNKEWWGE